MRYLGQTLWDAELKSEATHDSFLSVESEKKRHRGQRNVWCWSFRRCESAPRGGHWSRCLCCPGTAGRSHPEEECSVCFRSGPFMHSGAVRRNLFVGRSVCRSSTTTVTLYLLFLSFELFSLLQAHATLPHLPPVLAIKIITASLCSSYFFS